ncbi:MAG TPA: adenylate/guanylate cyclase domain-containing protein, partial [Roseiarcus sp.]|nr:adenylate/guanylate cyclase domain-containing protein [Roseiarcus sp.]
MASEHGERKLAAILAADVVGYSRLAGADEERTLARLRALRSDLVDPTIALWRGRVVKRTGDGILIEFRSVVDAMRCAIEVQNGMAERNAGLSEDRRLQFRVGVHLGDVVEEADGDLMGDGVNIAARLEGIAEPGGICLSAAAYEQVRDRLKEQFLDLGERTLKNIARPVRIYAVRTDATRPSGALLSDEPQKSGPPRLSIVVLPFANIGGDASRDYFVDGVTETLTTDLSRIRGSFVIARNTAFSYKGKAVDVKQIGRELNVRYVLEGSVQSGGARLRVNVQLIEAETGNHLWADRFDKPVADLFEMQDEIVVRLANQLNAQLMAVEARRAAQTPKPDSMDFYFQGKASLNKGWTLESLTQAREFFQRAIAADPTNSEAVISSAGVDVLLVASGMVEDRETRLAAAEAAVASALALSPDNAMAHRILGGTCIYTGRADLGIAQYERALALDPNLAHAHAIIGFAKLCFGRVQETEAHVREALRLSPRDVSAFAWYSYIGSAKLLLGADEEAVAWYRKSIEANRNAPFVHYLLAAALNNIGRHEEARMAMKAAIEFDPTFTIRRWQKSLPPSDLPVVVSQ